MLWRDKIKRNIVKKELQQIGIDKNKIIDIYVKQSIEDWILIDLNGICTYLGVSQNQKLLSKNGIEKMEELFKKKNRPYVKGKGKQNEDMICSLDMGLIMKNKCNEIKPICRCLGLVCDGISHICNR
jgi:hypothetical protein